MLHLSFDTAGRGSTTTQTKKLIGWRRRSKKKSCVKLRWECTVGVEVGVDLISRCGESLTQFDVNVKC